MEEEQLSGSDGGDLDLDLTNAHLPSLEEVEISPTLKVLDLTCNRLKTIDERILALTGLVKLSMRQNLLENADAVNSSQSKAIMEDLELRDNKFQAIKSMAGISDLGSTRLSELYLAANKIPKMEGLDSFDCLKILELGSNRIRSIENISHLQKLQELWLGRNRICEIQNLSPLTSLRQLSLQSNRLLTMKGIEECVTLEELYLSHNSISMMEGLDALINLRVLDLGNNRLTEIANVDNLTLLEDLWVNDNSITSWNSMYEALGGPRTSLTTVYLENNPVASDPMYQRKMVEILPNLTQLDGNAVKKPSF